MGIPDHLKVSGACAAITGEKLLTLVGTFWRTRDVANGVSAQVNVVAGGALPTPPPVKPTPTNPTPVPTVTLTPVPTGDPDFQPNDEFWCEYEEEGGKDKKISIIEYAKNHNILYLTPDSDEDIEVTFKPKANTATYCDITIYIFDEKNKLVRDYNNSVDDIGKGDELDAEVTEGVLKVGYTLIVELTLKRTCPAHNVKAYVTIKIGTNP